MTSVYAESNDMTPAAHQMMEELRDELRKSQAVSGGYARQIEALQVRLEDATHGHNNLEMRLHESYKKVESLVAEQKELVRQRRDLESVLEVERRSMAQEREHSTDQEQQLRAVIARLKETLAQKTARTTYEHQESKADDPPSSANDSDFAPRSTPLPSTPRQRSNTSLEKDRMIENLRLELAEAQIKLVESENLKGGRLQELEKQLMHSRVDIARLMEETESYQLLLSEKTLNGDFSRTNMMRMSGSGEGESEASETPKSKRTTSLADELHAVVEENDDHESVPDSEIKNLKDQNKALTLYINRILEKLLQHKDLESILDKTPDLLSGMTTAAQSQSRPAAPPPPANTEKDLPVTPPRDESLNRQRPTRQVGLRSSPKPRPMSFMAPTSGGGYLADAASQLGRSSSVRRASSRTVSFERGDGASSWTSGGPNRGEQVPSNVGSRTNSAAVPASRRYSLFSSMSGLGATLGAQTRTPSGEKAATTSSNGAVGEHREPEAAGTAAAPPASSSHAPTSGSGGAAFGGRQLRPLRLVQGQENQNKEAEEEAAKKARRSSWMGWFNKGMTGKPGEGSNPMGGDVVRE